MPPSDYYQVLGVSRFASREKLRRAFRTRLLLVHPDRNPDDPLAPQRTRDLVEAYTALSGNDSPSRRDLTPPESAVVVRAPRIRTSATYSQFCSRLVAVIGAVGLLVLLVMLAVQAFAGDRQQVFKPFLNEVQCAETVAVAAVVMDPNPTDCVEWYNTRQYQWCSASRYAAAEMVASYARAAQRAYAIGDFGRARFYRDAIDEIVRAQTRPVL